VNLIEAIKSGRPLRRPIAKHMGSHGTGWLANSYVVQWIEGGMDMEDFLADDWETKDVEVTITRSQFWEAVNKVVKQPPIYSGDLYAIARELGLGEP
jgi:hypothetical protein